MRKGPGGLLTITTALRLSMNYRLKIHLISAAAGVADLARALRATAKAFNVDLFIERSSERRELTHERGPIGAQGCVRELDYHRNGPYIPNFAPFRPTLCRISPEYVPKQYLFACRRMPDSRIATFPIVIAPTHNSPYLSSTSIHLHRWSVTWRSKNHRFYHYRSDLRWQGGPRARSFHLCLTQVKTQGFLTEVKLIFSLIESFK